MGGSFFATVALMDTPGLTLGIRGFTRRTGAVFATTDGEARFGIQERVIYIPPRSRYESDDLYHWAIFHELVHWARNLSGLKSSDKDAIAFEEAVAALGAMLLCRHFNMDMIDVSIDYMASHLGSNAPRGMDEAFWEASKVVEYLLASPHGVE